jgi:hypothetical protein
MQLAKRQQALGLAFFTAFAMCLMGTMTLVAPVLTANAIGAERLARTLPVLLPLLHFGSSRLALPLTKLFFKL